MTTDRRRTRNVGSGDTGQAAVEFAFALPLIVIVMLAIAQLGVSIRNEIVVELAAREGARAAAVSAESAVSAATAARRAVDLPMTVSVSTSADTVTVTVTYVDPTDIALIGVAIGPITHTASVTMAIEPP
jgi:Flp pilus assembly protein TadG